MTFDRVSAATIVVGSVLFIAAAVSPISRIFGMPNASERLEVITAAPDQWLIAQVLFALGSIVTVIGIGWLAVRLSGRRGSGYVATSTALMGVGAILWSWHVYLRAVDPARFTAGEIPVWLFVGYSLLTLAGLAFLGVSLLKTGLPSWAGWLPISGAVILFLLAVAFGDMPPFVYYVITLAVGVALYRAAASGSQLVASQRAVQ